MNGVHIPIAYHSPVFPLHVMTDELVTIVRVQPAEWEGRSLASSACSILPIGPDKRALGRARIHMQGNQVSEIETVGAFTTVMHQTRLQKAGLWSS
jgi:hypothetical protein